MNIETISYRIRKGLAVALLAAATMSIPACDRLHEDLPPCVTGIQLRFVDNENMDESNRFYKQVHCLNLFVYDAQGNILESRTALREEIEDENWRMYLELPPGKYKLLAYGGMDCKDASFSFTSNPSETLMQDLEVRLDQQYASQTNNKPLHYLFYGALDFDVPQAGIDTGYMEATLEMMKDTNDIRIILANENGLPTDADDFDFNIICDNSLMNYQNDIVPTSPTTYWPWTSGNSEVGLTESGNPATVAWAEISTARFVFGNPTTLLITSKSDGHEVVRLPLLNILMLYKSERPQYYSWTAQQYLDRESRWNMTFFLTADGRWLETKIVVNDWVVRINNIDDL